MPHRPRRPRRLRRRWRPALSEAQILQWADSHFARTGQWPAATSGAVTDNRNETWFNINTALRLGFRGLPGGRSLIRLLYEERMSAIRRSRPR